MRHSAAAPCSGEATDASTNFWEVVAQFGYFSIVTSAPRHPSPGADVARASPVPVQMWQGWAQSRRICGQGEPSLGADVARLAMSRRRCGEPPSTVVVYAWASLPARRPADTAPSRKCRTSLTRAWMAKYVRSSWAGRGCTAVRSSRGSEVIACLLLRVLSLGLAPHGKTVRQASQSPPADVASSRAGVGGSCADVGRCG